MVALIWILRERLRVVRIINAGAEMIMRKATNWIGVMVSPKNSQPRIRYKTGASWIKIPRLVELSSSRAL